MHKIIACATKDCAEEGKIKKVGLQYIGQGLYLDAPIICGGCQKRVKAA